MKSGDTTVTGEPVLSITLTGEPSVERSLFSVNPRALEVSVLPSAPHRGSSGLAYLNCMQYTMQYFYSLSFLIGSPSASAIRLFIVVVNENLKVLNHLPCTFLGMVARNSISEIIMAIATKLTLYKRPLLE